HADRAAAGDGKDLGEVPRLGRGAVARSGDRKTPTRGIRAAGLGFKEAKEMGMKEYLPAFSYSDSDSTCITAGNNALRRQAQMTADTYMRQAIEDIDDVLGKGYAKAHPELIAAYMQTAAIDMGGAVIARAIEITIKQAAGTIYDAIKT